MLSGFILVFVVLIFVVAQRVIGQNELRRFEKGVTTATKATGQQQAQVKDRQYRDGNQHQNHSLDQVAVLVVANRREARWWGLVLTARVRLVAVGEGRR